MSSGDRIKKLMTDLQESLITLDEKEGEIKRLREQNEALKDENDKLKQQQFKAPDHQYTPPRNLEFTRKAAELRKIIDDMLGQGQEHSFRPQKPYQQSVPTISPISFVHNADVNKSSTSTSESSKLFRSDEPVTNGTNHLNHENGNHSFSNQDDFSSNRPSDQDLITQANPPHSFYNGHNFVPTTVNNIGGPKRFGPGMNNNNNNNNRRNNINNNHNNNNNNNNKYTIFIAWTGSVSTADQLRELFDPSDVVDIRYTPPKQFAHVDLKSEAAMKKAMSLDQQTKNETQGQLRVETGKPRSSNNNNNSTDNIQRSQNQTKNYNNNRQNKNPNFNNNLPQKHNNNNINKYNNNYQNRNNSHSSPYPSFPGTDEKENSTNVTNGTSNWQSYASSASIPQQAEPKPTGESH